MKKIKLLTSLAALALVVGLGSCEVNVDVGGDVTIGGDTASEDSGEATSSEESPTETSSEDDTTEDSTDVSTSENDGEGGSSDSSSDGSTILPPVGEEDIDTKTLESLVFVLTLYDEDTNEVQTCPSNGYLSYRGTFNGEDNGSFLEDGQFVTLTETTNSTGQVAYTYTFSNVLVREDHNFTLLFYYNNSNFNGTYAEQTIASSISTPVPATTQSGDTLEFSLTCTNLANKFTAGSVTEEPEIEGGGLNPDGGDDTKGDDGTTGPTIDDPIGDADIDNKDGNDEGLDDGTTGPTIDDPIGDADIDNKDGNDEDLDGGSASVDPDDKNAGSTESEDTKDDGTTGPTIDDPIGDADIDNKDGNDENLDGGIDADIDNNPSAGLEPGIEEPIG